MIPNFIFTPVGVIFVANTTILITNTYMLSAATPTIAPLVLIFLCVACINLALRRLTHKS